MHSAHLVHTMQCPRLNKLLHYDAVRLEKKHSIETLSEVWGELRSTQATMHTSQYVH